MGNIGKQQMSHIPHLARLLCIGLLFISLGSACKGNQNRYGRLSEGQQRTAPQGKSGISAKKRKAMQQRDFLGGERGSDKRQRKRKAKANKEIMESFQSQKEEEEARQKEQITGKERRRLKKLKKQQKRRHLDIQDKKTRKRMKKNKREAQKRQKNNR